MIALLLPPRARESVGKLTRRHSIRGVDRTLRLPAPTPMTCIAPASLVAVIRVVVMRHGRQVIHAHVCSLGADEKWYCSSDSAEPT